MKRHLIVPTVGLAILFLGGVNLLAVDAPEAKTSRVDATVVIPADVGSFDGHTLEIRLYKIHHLLADASATLVEKVEVKDYGHVAGKETKTSIVIGAKAPLDEEKMHYVTVFILQDGRRTHIGQLPGQFLCKVLTEGRPNKIEMKIRKNKTEMKIRKIK